MDYFLLSGVFSQNPDNFNLNSFKILKKKNPFLMLRENTTIVEDVLYKNNFYASEPEIFICSSIRNYIYRFYFYFSKII